MLKRTFSVDTNSSLSGAEQRSLYRGAGRSRAGHLAMILRNFNKTTGAYEGIITTNNVVDLQSIGAQANTAGSGIAISATATGALRVFSDDAGAAIAESVRGAQSRFLVTYNQAGGTIRALQGQLKILTGKTVGTGIYTAVQGYAELVGTLGVNSGATFSCFDASLELGGVMTVASGGEAYGIHVETTGTGTITNSGTCAAIGITKAAGAATWPVGLIIGASATTTGVSIGTCTTGISITGATTDAISISGDATNAINITSGCSPSGSALLIAGAAATPISITGAFTTGISIAADGTTGVIVTSAFSGTTGIEFAGTATDGLKVSGICADAIEISAAATTTGLNVSANCVTGINIGVQTTTGISFAGGGSYNPIHIGVKSDTADAGLILTGVTDDTGGIMMFCDDGGDALGSVTSPIWTRYLLTVAQGAGGPTATGMFAQLKTQGSITCTTGSYTALKAYNQAGTVTLVTSAEYAVINAGVTLAGTMAVGAGCTFSGVDVNIGGAGTVSNSGTAAGVIIRSKGEGAVWPDGILIDGASVTMGMRIGMFAGSAATSSAVQFTTTMNVYGDGQASVMEAHGASASDLGSGYCTKVGRFRHIVNCTTAAHETYGLMGQLVVKDTTLTHLHAGLIGTLEGHTSGVVVNSSYTYGAAAIMARVGGAAYITATTGVAGVCAFWNGAALASGVGSSAFAVCDSGTTLWLNALAMSRATNALALPAAGTAPVATGGTVGTHGTSTVKIAITVGGVTHYLLASTVPTFA